ncbi:DUF1801 domain-containing protein [Phototrophicus methaneseepsis]|uniref:DUF1801 domain-containing protein n=1 Tax=Phototrophicus methaneseepsis TaxID=2710758 RepID=A0A7S8EBJ8_9CHLR|nr:DUF1801 domain-containing protein [Phototrophicus methaneseepsis]QPC83931.1 DUF1801 domain-containing protein [Phototrophicus methaneseepsis]
MAEIKTQPHDGDVRTFLSQVENEKRREDAFTILELMEEVTGEEAVMWGESIIGFGSYHYRYASGREGDWMLAGFAPRKQNLSLYIMAGFDDYDDLMSKIGKHKTGKSCLYINKVEDIDLDVLRELVKKSVDHMKATNPDS